MIYINRFCLAAVVIFVLIIQSCGKKEEQQTFVPPQQETSVDKEKEQKEREEFERLKRLSQDTGSKQDTTSSLTSDTSKTKTDTSKTSANQKVEKKKFVQKEKELNKRLDNPKTAISDYLEFLKRGISEGGDFEQNMKKASDVWQSSNVNRFKNNYKDTKKLIILQEPNVISQKGSNATVEVKLKKIDQKNNKPEESEMIVRYNLVADEKGKWKIKNNVVTKK